MPTIHVEVDATKTALDLIALRVQKATLESVVEGAALVESRGKKNAPVSKGNNPPIHGTLRRSISMGTPTIEGPGVFSSRGGPSVIYARRVELGFHGADSLGRVYDQDGRPYWGPAVNSSHDDILAIFLTQLADALEV